EPGSFTPLLRVETENTELAKTRHRSLAEKLEQEGSGDGEAVQFPAALRAMLDRLEDELRRDAVSEESRAWLTQCGLTAEQMKNQLEPRPEPERKVHLYHCDHRGLPLALISPANTVAWRAEYDEWGNLLGEENPEHLEQLIRLPGQQYDEESGLHYNRHRYYNPGQGRYITQDPAGLAGGWNPYQYPLNPIHKVDPLGLKTLILVGGATTGNPFGHAALAFSGHGVYSYGTNTKFGSKATDYLASQLSYRDTTLYELDTTPEQEKEMMQHIKENYSKIGDYSILHHDCATMVLDAMSTAGVSRDFIIYAIANGGKPAQL
ncbi:RHS domain-containing protein, partial [Salmonella enterica]|nr:RHS domain-containing protein [Salmonella enterica]